MIMLLAYASHRCFKLLQMHVKSAFFKGYLNEEVYIHKPPRALYEILIMFFIKNGYSRGKIETTFFWKINNCFLIILQVYVDDIISRVINEKMFEDFSNLMQSGFEMSMSIFEDLKIFS